jgi:hypothetical protein
MPSVLVGCTQKTKLTIDEPIANLVKLHTENYHACQIDFAIFQNAV